MPSHEAMDIAEKLYNKGFISYPRTETQRYSFSENLKRYVEQQNSNPFWGEYAEILIKKGRYTNPRRGSLDDKSHPPIHPVKYPDMLTLTDKEIKIYELITRHFIASVSPDANAEETIVELEIGEEIFSAKGLRIVDYGYFEVFNYEKWESSFIPNFKENQEIKPDISFNVGTTSPPNYLSESDLISLMDKHGIGTDATIHEHIKHIQERGFAFLCGGIFKPSLIGTTLVKMYQDLGIELYKPNLRANMEKEIKDVCEGLKQKVINKYLKKDPVYNDMKIHMMSIFKKVFSSSDDMKGFVVKYLKDNKNFDKEINLSNYSTTKFVYNQNLKDGDKKLTESVPKSIGPKTFDSNTIISVCPTCKTGNIRIILSKGNNYFIGCTEFPTCKHTGSLNNQPINV